MKMKMNMIINKRHIALAALMMALGVAVYLNWQYMNTAADLTEPSGSDAAMTSGEAEGENEVTTYGEAYFAEAKLSRTKSRDEAVESLKYMLEDAELDTETRMTLTTRATELAESIETEGKIENMIKAKGFEDCMVYLEEEKVDVIVKCSELTDSEAAQIMDAVLGEVSIPENNISIIEIN